MAIQVALALAFTSRTHSITKGPDSTASVTAFAETYIVLLAYAIRPFYLWEHRIVLLS